MRKTSFVLVPAILVLQKKFTISFLLFFSLKIFRFYAGTRVALSNTYYVANLHRMHRLHRMFPCAR